jgi:hypothetical protein
MLSLFRRIVCYVIAMQMALTPLYGASAALPVVPVADTAAHTLLTSQVIALANLNIKLLELNNAQTATNTKLDFILKAIKYIPPETKESFPSTDNVLLEFSSSLYAAYTENSTIYKTLRDSAAAGRNRFKDAPRAGPTSNEKLADTLSQGKNGSLSQPNEYSGDTKPRLPFDQYPDLKNTYNPKSAIDPSIDLSKEFNANLQNNPTALQNVANFTGQVRTLSEDLGRTYYALQGLRGNCQGGGLNCAQSGLNFLTNLPDVLGKFGIALSPDITKNIGQIGQIGGAIFTLAGTFGGGKGIDVAQITNYIQSVQGFLIGSGLVKGGFILPDTLTTSAGSLESIFYNLTGLFGLPGLEAMGRTRVPDAIAQLGDVAGAAKDSFRTGPLSKDTPLTGSPSPRPLTPKDIAQILAAINQCPEGITSTAECEKIKGENQRFFVGLLKANCAATAISQQRIPAALFQELFTGTGNSERCKDVKFYKTKGGKELCPSIALLQASSLAEGAVGSQLNVLIGLSMFNLVMTNVNTEQVILQNACASMGDLLEKRVTLQQTIND